MPSDLSPIFRGSIPILIVAGVLVAAGHHFVDAFHQRQALELMRAENRLLDRENRLLRQELEAERLQSAALTRLLQGTAGRPPAPAPAAPGP